MFYLLKRVDEKQCNVGDKVMVLADFTGIRAGSKGIVCEIYDEGVTIAWIRQSYPGTNKSEEEIISAIASERCYPAAGFDTDGFSRDELKYLVFETEKYPQ